MTLNLTPRAVTALERLTSDGTSKTDAINRAVMLSALVTELSDGGPLTLLHADGSRDRVHIL